MSWSAIPGREVESELTLFSEGSLIKGEVTLDRLSRVHGRIEGNIFGLKDSTIIIGETGTVHGRIEGNSIIIDGFVYGNVTARQKVCISETGRLVGDIYAPNIELKFGSYFEGRAVTEGRTKPAVKPSAAILTEETV